MFLGGFGLTLTGFCCVFVTGLDVRLRSWRTLSAAEVDVSWRQGAQGSRSVGLTTASSFAIDPIAICHRKRLHLLCVDSCQERSTPQDAY